MIHTEHFKARVVERTHKELHYELVTTFWPSWKDIDQAQSSLGYDPRGYGPPVCIDRQQLKSGKWVTRWSSAASCD